MANLFQPSLIRGLDTDANPTPFGQLRFDQTGTTTPATIFVDQAGATPHTNPVVADASGRFPPVYLDAETTYRVRWFDKDGALIPGYDIDPVRGYDEGMVQTAAQGAIAAAEQTAADRTQTGEDRTAAEEAAARADAASQYRISIAFKTWAELSAVTGTASQTAAVFQDAGTHTDPVVGGTVNNTGNYRYSTSPAGWERVSDLPEQSASQSAADAAASAASVAGVATQAVKSDQVAQRAVNDYATSYVVVPTANYGATAKRIAKAFDAHATNDDDTSVRVGRLIGAILFHAIPPNAVSVRARLYKRLTTENGVPGGGYDTLVADTGAVALGAVGIRYSSSQGGQGLWRVPLPTAQIYRVAASERYVCTLEFLDGANATVAMNPGYKQLGANLSAQALAGYVDTAGTWTNVNLGRPFGFGFAEPVFQDVSAISVTATTANMPTSVRMEPQRLRETEKLLLDRYAAGQWRYPGTATVATAGREGLANAMGDANWAAGFGRGASGADFGAQTSVGSMTDLTADPRYDAANKRLRLIDSNRFNAVGGYYYEKVKAVGAFIEASANRGVPITFKDFYFDANGDVTLLYGISQPSTLVQPGLLTLSHGTIVGYALAAINVTNVDIRACDLQFTAADIVVGGLGNGIADDGMRSVYMENCLMRRPANSAHPAWNAGAHADILQMTNVHRFSMVGSALYMPSTDSAYNEGAAGTTSSFAWSNMQRSDEVFVIGNIISGGSYNLYLGLAPTGAVYMRNQFFVNNLWLGGGENAAPIPGYSGKPIYNSFGEVVLGTGASPATTGTYANIGFFGNWAADGYPFRLSGAALPAVRPPHIDPISGAMWKNPEGIFSYDKTLLTSRSKELLIELGRVRRETIIDPMTLDLNPLYNLGNLRTA